MTYQDIEHFDICLLTKVFFSYDAQVTYDKKNDRAFVQHKKTFSRVF
jgi:hypothetical protein